MLSHAASKNINARFVREEGKYYKEFNPMSLGALKKDGEAPPEAKHLGQYWTLEVKGQGGDPLYSYFHDPAEVVPDRAMSISEVNSGQVWERHIEDLYKGEVKWEASSMESIMEQVILVQLYNGLDLGKRSALLKEFYIEDPELHWKYAIQFIANYLAARKVWWATKGGDLLCINQDSCGAWDESDYLQVVQEIIKQGWAPISVLSFVHPNDADLYIAATDILRGEFQTSIYQTGCAPEVRFGQIGEKEIGAMKKLGALGFETELTAEHFIVKLGGVEVDRFQNTPEFEENIQSLIEDWI